MDRPDLRERIRDQFSYRDDRADIWRGFDLVVDTDEFLNLGYSRWYQPHLVGSSQRRLASEVGRRLVSGLDATDGRLLDVGCGRGGPAAHLATRFGFDVTGVDLVPYNVAQAATNVRERDAGARFVVGDATCLPFVPDSMIACTAIDALVYLPDRAAVVSEIADVLAGGGVVVVTDLVAATGIDDDERNAILEFADAWDMPPLGTVDEYRRMFVDAGLTLRTVEDITRHSVGRFRKWTSLFLALCATPVRRLVGRLLRWYGLDAPTVLTQVRRAHDALSHLEHVAFVAER